MRWIFLRKLTFIVLSVIFWASLAQAAWYDSNWQYRKQITIDPSKVLADQTDFPVLVTVTADADLQTHAQLDGDDILFTAADGLTQLSHEIESYDGAAGNLVAWVKVPALSGSANTVIYLYYGNGPVGPQEDGQNVWIAEYNGVWHLDEDQAGSGNNDVYLDSTFPFNHGSDHIAANGQEGKIGKGQQFSGDGDYISVPHHTSLNLTGPMTLSYWIKLLGDAGEWNRVIEKGNGGFTTAYYFGGGDGTNDVTFYLTDTEVFDTADNALTTGNWHHVAVTYASNGDATFILDGTATPSGNYSGMIVGNTDSLYVSNPDPTWDSAGYLDEIRIAGADLGADWVITEYNNQSAPADFYTVGPEENLFHISGTVFEDADFAGTASAYDGGVSDLALANVDVELYDGADTFIGTTTTAGDGTFSFTGLTDGSYKVRVRSATIGDADTPPAGGLNADVPAIWPYPLAEMTWGYGSALYGGQSSTADDSDTADDSGPGDSYVTVTVNGGHLTGVNIGFAYNLIVNTLDDGLSNNTRSNQGSLRQFLKNANGIGAAGGTTANYSRFRIPGVGPHTVSTVSALPVIVETATLDGDDAGGGRVAIDGTTAGNVIGLSLSGSDITVANLVIQNFFGASSEGIRIHDGTNRNTISNCLIQEMNLDGIRVDWLGADTDLDHQITGCTVSGSGHDGIVLINVDGISVTNCIIEGSTRHGMNLVGANNGSGNNLIAGNTIRGNGNQGISIWDTGCTGNIFHSNIIHSNFNNGLAVGAGGNETRIYHNVFDNNGTSGSGSGVVVSSGVTGVIARNTLFTNNNSYGLSDGDGGTSTSIDYSGFYGNGTAACNYDCLTGSQNITPDPQYEPPGPPASFSLTECSSPAINAGIDLGVDQPDLNGSDQGNYNGPAPDMGAIEASCGATVVYEISGLVFEDIVGDVLDDGAIGDANNPGVEGVDVYLYLDDGDAGLDAGDTLIGGAPAQTDASGNYSFTGLNDGDYFVVVDSKTVGSTQDPTAVQADIWAEQTYGPVGAYFDNGIGYGIRVSAGPCYGGIAGHLSDDFSQWDDREHRAILTVSGSNVSNIDFGFSFNVVTNLVGGDGRDDDTGANRSVQGSLRQFIQNANAIDAANPMRFVPAESPGAVDGLGNSWWRLMVTEILPTITGDGTTIDGSAFDHLDGTTPLNPNAAQIGAGLPVGTVGTYTTPKLDPELEIRNFRGTAVLPTGLVFEATDSVLRHVSIWGFGDSASSFDANVLFGTNFSTTPDFTGSLVEFCVIGTGPAAFTEPDATDLSGRKNLTMRETDNAVIRDNLIGFTGGVGVDFNSGSNSGLVLRNEFRRNGILDPMANPVSVWISGAVTGNLITDNASGIYSAPTLGIGYQDNTITANGWGGSRPNAIQVSGSSVTIQRNVIADNAGAAVVVNSTTTGTQVTRNSIHGNGAVTGQIGIDLLASGDDPIAGPFVTVNDDGDVDAGGNDLLNFPVLDTVRLQGADLVVTGWARPSSQIEFYVAAPDPLGFGEGETWLITKTEGSGEDDDPTTTTYGPGAVNGVVQGTDTTNRFSFTIPLASLAAPVVVGDELTALAILGGNTSEFGGYVTVDGFTISGVVFEDGDFAGTASAYDGGTNDMALANVDVELYEDDDTYLASTTTAGDGSYSLTDLADGTYKVRVRSATIGDADTPPAAGFNATVPGTWPYPLAEMTWADGAAFIGGQDAAVDDMDTAPAAGPGDTWTAVTVSGGDVTGVNLGFAFNLIVNTLDDGVADAARSDQGSLRQFFKNANAIAGSQTSQFDIAAPLVNGFHTVQPISSLPTLDDPVNLDGTTVPGYSGAPLMSLDGVNILVAADGLVFADGSDGSTARGLTVVRFTGDGVHIDAGADGITVAGSWIGSDGNDDPAMGNGDDGIEILGASATIGGLGANYGNVVNNNGDEGINLMGAGADNATIQGNIIGLEPDGTSGSGNGDVGIAVLPGSSGHQIGGTDPAARNVISKNIEGIEINTNGNVIEGNFIGTDITGTADLGNHPDDGIEIQAGTNNIVGGDTAAAGNVIAFNGRNGMSLLSAGGNSVLYNSIHSNDLLGIDLGNDGVTENDGADSYLDFPVIESATESGGIATVSGTFDVPAGNYRLEFYANPVGADPSGNGEGQTYVGSKPLVHTGSGPEPFGATFPGVNGDVITATLTQDLGASYGSSSEFSDAVTVVATRAISGVVFEDTNFGGTAENWDGGTSDVALANVDVELYTDANTFVMSTTTAGDGSFSFPGVAEGNTYKIRARSATIGEPDTPPAGGYNATVPATWPYPLAEMTWGHSAALIGGQDTSADDTDTADNAGPGDTWVAVTVSGGDVSGVNFGFCYDLIVNEDDDANADNLRSKQGTLRQFIKNSNAIMGVNKSWFQIPSL